MSDLSIHDIVTGAESILKSLAIIGATGFFLYKLKTGWLIVNMGVSIRTKRRRIDKERDHMALIVALDKGSTDSVYLRDIQFRVCKLVNGVVQECQICPAQGFAPIGEMENGRANWLDLPKRGEIAVSPGEKLEYAAYAEVDRNQAYLVEVAVFGHNWFYRLWSRGNNFIQWRASTISLPGDK